MVCDGSKTISEAADVKNGKEVNYLLKNLHKESDNDKYLGICHLFVRDEDLQVLLLQYMKQTFKSRRKNSGDSTRFQLSENAKNDVYSVSTDYDSEEESNARRPVVTPATFKCQYCSKILRGQHGFKNHCMRKHGTHGEKNILCDKCPTLFFTDFEFTRHYQTHYCVRNFLCHLCSKKFVQKSTLELHLRYHVNDRRYQCGVCRKKFFTKNHLNRHCLIHTNRRDFKCVPCNRSFRYKDHLRRHIHKVHTGVRSHFCGRCFQSFKYLSQLRFHERFHTKCPDGNESPRMKPQSQCAA